MHAWTAPSSRVLPLRAYWGWLHQRGVHTQNISMAQRQICIILDVTLSSPFHDITVNFATYKCRYFKQFPSLQVQWDMPITEPQWTYIFRCSKLSFNRGTWSFDPLHTFETGKPFQLMKRFRYAQVTFKAGFTVYRIWLKCGLNFTCSCPHDAWFLLQQ